MDISLGDCSSGSNDCELSKEGWDKKFKKFLMLTNWDHFMYLTL